MNIGQQIRSPEEPKSFMSRHDSEGTVVHDRCTFGVYLVVRAKNSGVTRLVMGTVYRWYIILIKGRTFSNFDF